jgi:hypothetical protein
LVIGKPKSHSLFNQVFLVEVLGQPQHPAEKVGTDLNRGLPNPARERRRFFDHQNAQAGFALEQEDSRGCAGERSANDQDVVRRNFPLVRGRH